MLSYHNKLRLKKWLRRGAITLAVLLVGFLVVLIYAEPYMIYSREGATFDPQATIEPTQTPRETTPRPEVKNPNIIYDADVVDAASVQELGGYYISTEMLRDPQTVLNSVKQLTKPCTVLIDIKSVFGNFYYSSAVSGASVADGDITACDELLSYLSSKGFYMVAALPTFSDPNFALQNQSSGLPIAGGALWMDENGCYWLNPADSLTQNYLLETFADLKRVGFREVALRDFRYPDSDSIVYPDGTDKAANLSALQATLDSFCARNELTLSYVTDATEFSLGGGTGRIYIPNADATKIELYKQAYAESGASELVFLSSSSDTRFDGTAVLRPLPLVSADDADASEPTDATDASEPTDATEPDTTDGGGFVGG